jgi:hypothetical protein
MSRMLARIKKWSVSENLPPAGSVPAGMTPDGKQLFYLETPRVKGVPKMRKVKQADGEIVEERDYAKNPMTAEPLYPKNKPERWTRKRLFFMEDQGNGNNTMVDYAPPTEEEIQREMKRQKVKAMEGQLAEALVDMGVDSPEALRTLLASGKPGKAGKGTTPPVESAAPATSDAAPFIEPKELGAGWWELANGTKVRGKKEQAREAQRRLREAKVFAEQTPEH